MAEEYTTGSCAAKDLLSAFGKEWHAAEKLGNHVVVACGVEGCNSTYELRNISDGIDGSVGAEEVLLECKLVPEKDSDG